MDDPDGTGAGGAGRTDGGADRAGREWNDPPGVDDDATGPDGAAGDRLASRRALRLTTGLLFLLVAVVWFRGPLGAVLPRLWPPGGPRWATLVLVVGLSLVLPMMVGAALGDLLHERL